MELGDDVAVFALKARQGCSPQGIVSPDREEGDVRARCNRRLDLNCNHIPCLCPAGRNREELNPVSAGEVTGNATGPAGVERFYTRCGDRAVSEDDNPQRRRGVITKDPGRVLVLQRRQIRAMTGTHELCGQDANPQKRLIESVQL